MAWIELFLIALKTILLSTIYSTLVLLSLIAISATFKNDWLRRITKRKLRFWLSIHFIISFGLFGFSFTYWQNTGLGDNSIIPIGYGQTIQNEDFESTYFYPDLRKTEPNRDELNIGDYKVFDNKICAEVSHQNMESLTFDYIIYDLPSKKLMTFKSEEEYRKFAQQNGLPTKKDFHDFNAHFAQYLKKRTLWKKWLVP